MMLLGIGIAITVPVLFATKRARMTTNQFGILLALATVSQFTVNSIVAQTFQNTHSINRKVLIISALMMGNFDLFLYS